MSGRLSSLLLVALLATGCATVAPVPATQWSPEARLHAVVVGVEATRDRRLAPTPNATRDADAVADWLTTTGGARSTDVLVLGSGGAADWDDNQPGRRLSPTRTNIRVALMRWLRPRVAPGDRVLFYFAGHGATLADGKPVLMPADASTADLEGSTVAAHWVAEQLGGLRASAVLCWYDTSFQGRGARTSPAAARLGSRIVPGPKGAVWLAAPPGELAREAKEAPHGAFTYELLRGLRTGDGTVADAWRRVSSALPTAQRLGRLVAGRLRASAHFAHRPELILERGHSRPVNDVAHDPAGRFLATAASDGLVKLWDRRTGSMLRDIAVGPERVFEVTFSGDGKWLVTGASRGAVRVWKVPGGEAVRELKGHTGKIVGVEAIARSDRVAVASDDGKVRIWNVAEGSTQRTLSMSGKVRAIAVDPAGEVVASSVGGKLTLDGISDGNRRWVSTPKVGIIVDLAFSNDGTLLWAGTSVGLLGARVVDGGLIGPLNVGPVKQIAAAPTRNLLALASYDEIMIADLATEETRVIPGAHRSWVRGLEFSPDSQELVSCGGDLQVLRWRLASNGPPRALTTHAGELMDLAFDARSGTLAAGLIDATLRLWDLDRGAAGRVLDFADGPPNSLAFAPDGKSLAIGFTRETEGLTAAFQTVGVVELPSGRLRLHGRAHALSAIAVGLDPNGRWLATGGFYGGMQLRSHPDGKLLAAVAPQRDLGPFARMAEKLGPHPGVVAKAGGHVSAVGAVAVSRGAQRIATAASDPDRYVKVWGPDGNLLRSLTRVKDRVVCLGFVSPDQRLLVGDTTGFLSMWEAGTGTKLWTRAAHSSFMDGCDLVAESQALLTHGEDRVSDGGGSRWSSKLWRLDPDGVKLRSTFDAGSSKVSLGALVRGGRVVVSAARDGALLFWDAGSGTHLATALSLFHDWIVVTPEGLFDGSAGGQRQMRWRVGDREYALDQFYAAFYSPGLLSRILSGERPRPRLAEMGLRPPPRVSIVSPADGASLSAGKVRVRIRVEDQGGGVSRRWLYHNGHRQPTKRGAVAPGGTHVEYEVELVEGSNHLRATAFNSEGSVESAGHEIIIQWTAPPASKPRLHIIAVGIDSYRAGLQLRFAGADAKAMAGFFGAGLFNDVSAHVLLDAEATHAAILAKLDEVSRQSSPRDVVLVYLAGHGTIVGQVFYFLPHDVDVSSDDAIRRTAVSQVELGEALTKIRATKQILVLDACHSGASAGSLGKLLARRDAVGMIRAQQRLARSAGSFLIAASTAEQYAKEVPALGHGVLTAAILRGLGEGGAPAAAVDRNGRVTVNALLRYLSDEVPRLTAKYHGGQQDVVQASTGQDFPLVVADVPRK